MVSVIWADGPWICCRSGEATWAIAPKEDLASWLHAHLGEQERPYGIQLQRCSRGLRCMVAGAVHAEQFLRKVFVHRYAGHVRATRDRIELNGSISPGSREVRTTWSSHFENSLMELILEYSITYPEVKKHCSLRHMQTDSRVKRRLVYWHYPMLNLLKIRTVNQIMIVIALRGMIQPFHAMRLW